MLPTAVVNRRFNTQKYQKGVQIDMARCLFYAICFLCACSRATRQPEISITTPAKSTKVSSYTQLQTVDKLTVSIERHSTASVPIECEGGSFISMSGTVHPLPGKRFYQDSLIRNENLIAYADPHHILENKHNMGPQLPLDDPLDPDKGTFLVMEAIFTDSEGRSVNADLIYRELKDAGKLAEFRTVGIQQVPDTPGIYHLEIHIYTPTLIVEVPTGGLDYGKSESVTVCAVRVYAPPVPDASESVRQPAPRFVHDKEFEEIFNRPRTRWPLAREGKSAVGEKEQE